MPPSYQHVITIQLPQGRFINYPWWTKSVGCIGHVCKEKQNNLWTVASVKNIHQHSTSTLAHLHRWILSLHYCYVLKKPVLIHSQNNATLIMYARKTNSQRKSMGRSGGNWRFMKYSNTMEISKSLQQKCCLRIPQDFIVASILLL